MGLWLSKARLRAKSTTTLKFAVSITQETNKLLNSCRSRRTLKAHRRLDSL